MVRNDQHQNNPNPKQKSKPSLKLVTKLELAKLQLGGIKPPESIKPGDYLARCDGAWTEPIGKNGVASGSFEFTKAHTTESALASG